MNLDKAVRSQNSGVRSQESEYRNTLDFHTRLSGICAHQEGEYSRAFEGCRNVAILTPDPRVPIGPSRRKAIPLLTQHLPLLQRNGLYTAITRAARIITAHARLVGDEKAIAIATKNNRITQGMTRLAERLRIAEH
jgi:hypothetical protein